mgnify:CR=1 FL=1
MAVRRLAGVCEDKKTCPGVWTDDGYPEDVIVVSEQLEPSPVPLGAGEAAVRVRRQIVHEARLEL